MVLSPACDCQNYAPSARTATDFKIKASKMIDTFNFELKPIFFIAYTKGPLSVTR